MGKKKEWKKTSTLLTRLTAKTAPYFFLKSRKCRSTTLGCQKSSAATVKNADNLQLPNRRACKRSNHELTDSSKFTSSNLGLYVRSTTCSQSNGIDPLICRRKFPKQRYQITEVRSHTFNFQSSTTVFKFYLHKWCCITIQLHNLLGFHKICNIPIRISSSSPHTGSYESNIPDNREKL